MEYDLDLIFEHFSDHTSTPKSKTEVVNELRNLLKAAGDNPFFPKITYDGAEIVLGVSDV